MDPTQFLLTCISDDECVARAAGRQIAEWYEKRYTHIGGALAVAWDDCHPVGVLTSVSRALLRCEADRKIVEWHHASTDHGRYNPYCVGCWEEGGEDGAPSFPCRTLRWLMLPYQDRPGYDPAWG